MPSNRSSSHIVTVVNHDIFLRGLFRTNPVIDMKPFFVKMIPNMLDSSLPSTCSVIADRNVLVLGVLGLGLELVQQCLAEPTPEEGISVSVFAHTGLCARFPDIEVVCCYRFMLRALQMPGQDCRSSEWSTRTSFTFRGG